MFCITVTWARSNLIYIFTFQLYINHIFESDKHSNLEKIQLFFNYSSQIHMEIQLEARNKRKNKGVVVVYVHFPFKYRFL